MTKREKRTITNPIYWIASGISLTHACVTTFALQNHGYRNGSH